MKSPIHWFPVVGIAAMLASSTLALNGQIESAPLVGSVALAVYATLRVVDHVDSPTLARPVA